MRWFVTYNIYVPKSKVKVTIKVRCQIILGNCSEKILKQISLDFACRNVKLDEKLGLTQNIGFHTQVQGQIWRSKVKLFLSIY